MSFTEKGIDISKWNGKVDFNAVKAAGYTFVIIKAGGSDYGFYKDPYFESNYKGAKAAGLKVGSYYFVGNKFWGAASGQADAERFYQIIKGKKFEYPIYLDIEAQQRSKKKEITDAAIAFGEYLEKKNYFVGVYGSEFSTFNEMVEKERLKRFTWWVANYSNKPAGDPPVWQCSSTTRIQGHKCNFDKNISNIDFEKIMKGRKKNGYS